MFKLCLFIALFAYGSAGIISYGDGLAGLGGYGGYGSYGGIGLGGLGGIALASPKVIAAPAIAVKAGATSYQNSNLLALHPTPVITKAIAAPVITKVAAPVSVIGVDSSHIGLGGLGGLGLGGLGYGIH